MTPSSLSLLGARILECKANLAVVNSDPIGTEVWCKESVHASVVDVDEFTEMAFHRFLVHVNTKGAVKVFRSAHTTQAINILLLVIPRRDIHFRIHVNNTQETGHGCLASATVLVVILPKVVDLTTDLGIRANRVVMKANGTLWCIKIVSNGVPSNSWVTEWAK